VVPGVVVGVDVPGTGDVVPPGRAVPGVAPVAGGMVVGPGSVFVHGAITVDVGDAVGVVTVVDEAVLPTPAALLVLFGVVPGCALVAPVVLLVAPVDVPLVPTAVGDVVDVVAPTRVFGGIGVRPSPTIAGVAGDVLGDVLGGAPAAFVDVVPGAVDTPAVVAGRHGSGLPLGAGNPGCRLPDCGAGAGVDVVVAELAPGLGVAGAVVLCA
jgi:hypothetical protein